MGPIYAVLTGDLVRSSTLSADELQRVQDGLRTAARELAVASWAADSLVVGELDLFRGDSWQLLLRRPGPALRAALFLRSTLLAQGIADTRIAIGHGTVE
ncbi:MAG TPA: hypothetical protein VKA48_11915, partial [Gammaproteobacteria bacterium]|nr:hypothetical protein [Gammaproteobacteria bacterium]